VFSKQLLNAIFLHSVCRVIRLCRGRRLEITSFTSSARRIWICSGYAQTQDFLKYLAKQAASTTKARTREGLRQTEKKRNETSLRATLYCKSSRDIYIDTETGNTGSRQYETGKRCRRVESGQYVHAYADYVDFIISRNDDHDPGHVGDDFSLVRQTR
jgi:hypothetical protein